jgi:hypothetical protein
MRSGLGTGQMRHLAFEGLAFEGRNLRGLHAVF